MKRIYKKKNMNFFLTGILFVFSLQLQWSLTPNRSREEERDNLNTGLFKLYTYPLPTNHGVIVAILKIGIVIWLRTRRTVTSNYSLREKNEKRQTIVKPTIHKKLWSFVARGTF